MNTTATTSLRGSCERCRAQKLRCVPSPATASGAPCKRCVGAQKSNSCVFSPRLRTRQSGPSKKPSGNVQGGLGVSRAEKGPLTPALPGMNTFVLSNPASLPPEAQEPLSPLSIEQRLRTPRLEDSTIDFWPYDAAAALDSLPLDAFLQQPSVSMHETSAHGQKDGIYHEESQGLSLSPSITPCPDGGVDLDMATNEKPSPLVDLTALLAGMSLYEDRLTRLSGCQLLNYPIGDAIFLSHRFHAILSNSSHLHATDAASQWGTPTMLLALSCFITLTRVFSAVFGHLLEQLSRVLEVHTAPKCKNSTFPLTGTDIDSYRGLRLRELQPVCICTGWDPTKKAVSMLLSSLGGAEGWLDLPSDVRIVANSGGEKQGEKVSKCKGIGGEKTLMFEEGSMAALTNGHLYTTIRKQAKALREKVEKVEELLKEVTELDYIS
ncbi:MAG: hypothetical protein Q9223_002818 [Gallowayella weberi]